MGAIIPPVSQRRTRAQRGQVTLLGVAQKDLTRSSISKAGALTARHQVSLTRSLSVDHFWPITSTMLPVPMENIYVFQTTGSLWGFCPLGTRESCSWTESTWCVWEPPAGALAAAAHPAPHLFLLLAATATPFGKRPP